MKKIIKFFFIVLLITHSEVSLSQTDAEFIGVLGKIKQINIYAVKNSAVQEKTVSIIRKWKFNRYSNFSEKISFNFEGKQNTKKKYIYNKNKTLKKIIFKQYISNRILLGNVNYNEEHKTKSVLYYDKVRKCIVQKLLIYYDSSGRIIKREYFKKDLSKPVKRILYKYRKSNYKTLKIVYRENLEQKQYVVRYIYDKNYSLVKLIKNKPNELSTIVNIFSNHDKAGNRGKMETHHTPLSIFSFNFFTMKLTNEINGHDINKLVFTYSYY